MSDSQDDPWVIRTDVSDEKAWLSIKEHVSAPQSDGKNQFYAYVRFIDHKTYHDKSAHDVVVSLPDNYNGFFCFIVDRETIENSEHPLLVVDFEPADLASFDRIPRNTPPGDIKTFRSLPAQIQAIENNLSIANVDFDDFAKAVDANGVFRGFQ